MEVDAADKTTYDNEDRNKLPLATSPGLYRNNASSYGRDLPDYYADETDHEIKGFSEIKKGHWYCKVGRTTDTTTGICHGTEVYCNIIDVGQRTRYDEATPQSPLQKMTYTEELVILNSKCGQSVYIQEDFCQPGDSGAWVIDANQCFAGLLFGGITGQCGPANLALPRTGFYINAGMVTSMPQVLKSIAQWITPRSIDGSPTGPPGRLEFP